MSAILETEPGNELVCIEAFSVLPKDVADRTKSRRNFRIGERVRYVGYYQDANLKDNPAGWMIVFKTVEPGDVPQYAATQTYFVTTECWESLKKYFARRLMNEPQKALSLRTRKGDALRKSKGSV
jgi:hypothetical protein